MKIFLSYGHDRNVVLVERIKVDLEQRGHDVWFDRSEIRFGDDWRRTITDGIQGSDWMLSFLSRHSTRDPGVCLDELGIALGVKGGIVQTILVESEQDVAPPVSVSHIQWLDMHDWRSRQEQNPKAFDEWYRNKLGEIVQVVESESSQRFAGEIEYLQQRLKPVTSDVRIGGLLRQGFVGRGWLLEELEAWRNNGGDSRIFWLTGAPGIGKSAFAAWLAHHGKPHILGVHFVEYNQPYKRDPGHVVRSIAFQLAARLPDFRKFLMHRPELDALDRKNPHELFDHLLSEPLNYAISGGREQYLVLIDALDEAGPELVEFLAQRIPNLPSWLSFVVTSRPDPALLRALSHLKPNELKANDERNVQDLRIFLEEWLRQRNGDAPVREILSTADGSFLYLRQFCDGVDQGWIDLNEPSAYPRGLTGLYVRYFQRQFPDAAHYEAHVLPLLELVLASNQPLPESLAGRILGWKGRDKLKALEPLGSLFPRTQGTITPFHKSLKEWLSDYDKAGVYYVPIEEGRFKLCKELWESFLNRPDQSTLPDEYIITELPIQLFSVNSEMLMRILYDQIYKNSKLIYYMIFFESCLKIFSKKSIQYIENLIKKINDVSSKLDELMRWKECAKWINVELEICKHFFRNKNTDLKISITKNLASVFYKLGKLSDSLTLQSSVVNYYQETDPYSYEYVIAMNLLASILSENGKLEEALDIQKKILELDGFDDDDMLMFSNNFALTLYRLGKLEESKNNHERNFNIFKKKYGYENKHTLLCMNNLGLVLFDIGNLKKTLSLQKINFHFHKKLFGENHPETITSMNNLALTYMTFGKLEKAKFIFEKCIVLYRKFYNTDNQKVLISMNNLGLTLYKLGNYDSAIVIQNDIVDISVRIFGKNHMTTLYYMNNLSLTLYAKGNISFAIELQKNIVDISSYIYGSDHHSTLLYKGNYITFLSEIENVVKIIPIQKQILQSQLRVLSPNHPNVLITMGNLANMLSENGDLTGAKRMQEEVLRLSISVFGEEHQDTLTAMGNLATTICEIGDLKDAKLIEENVYEISNRILGPCHPDTFIAKRNLSETMVKLGYLEESIKMKKDVLSLQIQELGSEHPETLFTMANLGQTLASIGEFSYGVKLQQDAVCFYIKSVGQENLYTLEAIKGLAATFSDYEEFDKAKAHQEYIVDVFSCKFGSDHPATLSSINSLSSTLSNIGYLDQALKMSESVLAIRMKKLGPDHPDTLSSMHNLGRILSKIGKYKKSKRILEKVLFFRKKRFGDNNEYTLNTKHCLAETLFNNGEIFRAFDVINIALQGRIKILSHENPNTIQSMNLLVDIYIKIKDFDNAKYFFKQILDIRKRTLGKDHDLTKACQKKYNLISDFFKNSR